MNNEWQPIETAPRDGELVLLVDKSGERYVGYHSRRRSHWVTRPGEWRIYPTHWQSLPEDPGYQP